MMSRTYHLLVLPIFAGFLTLGMAASVTLGLAMATSLTRTATATSTYTIRSIITRTIAFIFHFGCSHLKVGIKTITIAIGHRCTIIGSTVIFK